MESPTIRHLRAFNADHPRMLQNIFELNTRDEPQLAHSQINFTLQRLREHRQDPVVGPVYNRFRPKAEVYNAAFAAWHDSLHLNKILERGLDLKFREESERVAVWQSEMGAVLVNEPLLFRRILPQGTLPFDTGELKDRISALTIMAYKMEGHSSLEQLRKEVLDFTYELRECYHQHQSAKESLAEFCGALEIFRINAAAGLYHALNSLISAWPDKPDAVNLFFDFEELYRKSPRRYTISKLGAREIYSVSSCDWSSSDRTLTLENFGVSSIALYPANGRVTPPPTPALAVPSGKALQLSLDQFLPAGHSTICIYNPHDFHKAACNLSFN